MVATKSTNPPSPRSGFTLIELLVVIVVIAILAAFILPAIQNSIRTARITGVKTEINQLETAIAKFKADHGVEPPSSIVLYEHSGDWATFDTTGNYTAFIRQVWPQYDFGDHDINGNGNTTDQIKLTAGECLVFFLGGVNGSAASTYTSTSVTNNPNSRLTTYIGACTGFSKNPASPFDRGGSREAPLFDFNPARFTDLDNDGFPEYRDNLPPTPTNYPYLYYSSYDGQGYNESIPAEFDSTNPELLATPYWQGLTTDTPRWKPNSHQIISPGLDGKYGYGGPYFSTGSSRIPPTTTSGGRPTAADRVNEADNITNFSDSVLQP